MIQKDTFVFLRSKGKYDEEKSLLGLITKETEQCQYQSEFML